MAVMFRLIATVIMAQLLFPAVLPALAAEEAQKPAVQEGPLPDVWEVLLQNHVKALAQIKDEGDNLRKLLPEWSKSLSQSVNALQSEFQRLSAVAQVTRNYPTQRNVIIERIRRLQDQLQALLNSDSISLSKITARLDELKQLEADATGTDNPAMQDFKTQLSKTRSVLTLVQSSVNRALAPANKLNDDITAMRTRLTDTMPDLWKEYYLAPAGKILALDGWRGSGAASQSLRDALTLRMSTELPQTMTEWLLVAQRMLFTLVPLLLLLAVSWRAAGRLKPWLGDGWRRTTLNSAPLLVLGLSLHYASWGNGNLYQIITSFSTMILCWGQLTLAWDLTCFNHSDRGRCTPLWPLFPPLLMGMLLLYFDPYPVLLTLFWLLTLAGMLLLQHRYAVPADYHIAKGLISGQQVVLWLCLIITLLGWGRLSILVCMAYAVLAVWIQQTLAILALGASLEEGMPKEGGKALVAAILLAVGVPTVLVVLTVCPTLWILAYPGGEYLLQHLAGLGVSFGQLSLNVMQVVSILIAFYLTRALITVGRTFLNGLRRQDVRITPHLLGPMHTAYTYILWAFFGLYVMSSLGFSLTNLAVVAGGLSVGVGFGLQNIVQNFISGLMVIFGQIIREGDEVEVKGIMGTVRKVNIRSTQVETYDNAVVFIPNSDFLSTSFTNWTHNGRMVRREVGVGVAYGSDMELVMRLMLEVAAEHPKVLHYPKPMVLFTSFSSSSQDLLLRFWVADIDHGLPTSTALRLAIAKSFAENGVEISFPQLDIHIREGGEGAENAAETSYKPRQPPESKELSVAS